MRKSLKNIGLISTGVLAGVLLSLGITATAQRATDARSPLPIDEIRQFTDGSRRSAMAIARPTRVARSR